MVVLTGGQVFVLEFKMSDREMDADAVLDAAISQMRERGYAEKYRNRGEPVSVLLRILPESEPPAGRARRGR